MLVVENGCSLLGLGTLKSAVSQEWIDEMSWYLPAHTNLGKLNITSIIIGWACSKIGETL